MSGNLENSAVALGLEKLSFHWSRKERQCQRIFKLLHNFTHLTRQQDKFSSVAQLALTPCGPMDCNTPGFPVHHHFLELTQIHVHLISDAIHPSCPLSFHFSLAFKSLPASGSFLMSQHFPSGGQIIGASVSASVLPVNIQDGFPLVLTGLIFLLSKGLSRVFSNTTIQKHQFFGVQPSLWSIYT